MDLDLLLISIGSTELYKIAPELQKRGYKVGIISGSPQNFKDNQYIQENFPYWHINDLIAHYKNRIKYDADTVKEIKEEFEIPSFHSFYFPHMVYRLPYCQFNDFYKLSNHSENEILFKKTVETFQAIKFFFKDNQVKITIQNLGGEILRRTIFLHNQKYKIPHFFIENSVLPDHFVIFSDERGLWDELIIKSYDELSESEIKNSSEFINQFRAKKRNIVKIKDVKTSLNYQKVSNYLFHGKDRRGMLNDFSRKLKKRIQISSFYSNPDFDEKFVFFPLHYHSESRLTLRDAHCWRQEFIAEYTARCIPDGYKLYIKPHPEWPLDFPLEGLKLISNVSNIRLIDPFTSSLDLIEKSDAVIVVNSTAGFEALLYEKPVLAFGTEFYTDNDMIYKVTDFRKLPELIEKAITHGTSLEDLICFTDAFLKANRKGNFKNLDKDSALIVDGILDRAQKVGTLKPHLLKPICKKS